MDNIQLTEHGAHNNSSNKLIKFDDVYRVLKDLCGSPPYWEKANRDLYAVIGADFWK